MEESIPLVSARFLTKCRGQSKNWVRYGDFLNEKE